MLAPPVYMEESGLVSCATEVQVTYSVINEQYDVAQLRRAEIPRT